MPAESHNEGLIRANFVFLVLFSTVTLCAYIKYGFALFYNCFAIYFEFFANSIISDTFIDKIIL